MKRARISWSLKKMLVAEKAQGSGVEGYESQGMGTCVI